MLSNAEKAKLIDELIAETPDCTVGDYLDALHEIEGVTPARMRPEPLKIEEPKYIFSFYWNPRKTG